MWGDESEAVAPIIWLYKIVDAQKEEVFFPDFLITLQSYGWHAGPWPYGHWKSSTGAGLGYTGMYFLRNFQLRSVTLPEPSMRITYWSYWQTSITRPVLSHFLGWSPVWFCTRTVSPTLSEGTRWVCSAQRSAAFMWRLRRASSRACRDCRHVSCGRQRPGKMGIRSLMGQPKTHWAGDNLVSRSEGLPAERRQYLDLRWAQCDQQSCVWQS